MLARSPRRAARAVNLLDRSTASRARAAAPGCRHRPRGPTRGAGPAPRASSRLHRPGDRPSRRPPPAATRYRGRCRCLHLRAGGRRRDRRSGTDPRLSRRRPGWLTPAASSTSGRRRSPFDECKIAPSRAETVCRSFSIWLVVLLLTDLLAVVVPAERAAEVALRGRWSRRGRSFVLSQRRKKFRSGRRSSAGSVGLDVGIGLALLA